MVKQEFIYQAMREMDLRFFVVQDANYNLVYAWLQPGSLEDAVRKLQGFFKSAGPQLFHIKCFKSNELRANGEPKGVPYHYEVMHTETLQDEQPKTVTGMPEQTIPAPVSAMESMLSRGQGMMGGVGMDVYLSAKDKILELQLQIQRLEMEKRYLEDQLARKESDLRSEFDKKLNNETRIQGSVNQVLPTVMSAFGGGGQPPMNGVGQTENNMNQEQDTKNKVITAVNELLKLDPDFANNTSQLAELAKKNPRMYQTAVEMLKKF